MLKLRSQCVSHHSYYIWYTYIYIYTHICIYTYIYMTLKEVRSFTDMRTETVDKLTSPKEEKAGKENE